MKIAYSIKKEKQELTILCKSFIKDGVTLDDLNPVILLITKLTSNLLQFYADLLTTARAFTSTIVTIPTDEIFCDAAVKLRKIVKGDLEFFKENFNEILKYYFSQEQKSENPFFITYVGVVRNVAKEYMYNMNSLILNILNKEIKESMCLFGSRQPSSTDNAKIKRRSIFKPVEEIKEDGDQTQVTLCKDDIKPHIRNLSKSSDTADL